MANIKKNFNFRNGVQVDDDNLLVTATGLVGIGTTIPVEALDVRGNVIITGFTSATTQKVGFLTVTTLEPEKIIGAGISVVSGIVTAQGAGILTFFGDARNLQGMPTSQWEDVDVGLGFTSIYNTGGNVGVGTEDPRSTVQVGGNVDAGERGVGISSVGNINAAGIITATSLIGNLTGDVTGRITGDVVGDVNSTGISTFNNLNTTGRIVGAASSNVIPFFYANLTQLPSAVTYHGAVAHVHATGALYYAHGGNWIEIVDKQITGVVGTGTEIYNIQELETDQLKVTGVSTFTGLIDGNGGANIDNVQIGVTNDNEIDTSTGNLTIDSAGGTVTVDDQLGVSGIATFSDNVAVAGLTTTKDLQVTGTTTFNGAVNASSISVPDVAITTKLGIGFTDTPTTDIQVKKLSGTAEIQVSSLESIASLNVGREIGTAKTHTSEIRFGGGAGAPYSASGTSLDIINYDTGNFNYHLSGNNAAGVQGDFHWHRGINSARLMTLTGVGGSLGIGITQPQTNFDVEGAGQFSGNLTVGNNLTVGGALIGNVQGTLTGNVSGTLAGNANATVGITTLNNLTIAGVATISNARVDVIGINAVATTDRVVKVNDAADERLFVTSTGEVGIKTTVSLPGISIQASSAIASIFSVGIGVTILGSAVDLSTAGVTTSRFVIMPKMNNSGRNSLQNVVSGAVIYNTQTNTLQFYNGSGWRNVTSTAV